MTAAIVQFQKQEEAQFICTACGADRGCKCDAPAIEKLAQIIEQNRQHKRRHDEKKAQQKQRSGNVTEDEAAESAEQRKAQYADGLDGKTRKQPAKKPEVEEEDDDIFFEPTAEQKRRQKQFIERAKAAAKMGGYEGPIDSEMQDAAAAVADAWMPYAGSNRKWKTQQDGYSDLFGQLQKSQARNSLLTTALNAKEAQQSRNWPADMNPREIKKRDNCLRNIAAWQRDLEQLYGEVTGQPSWRVELTTKDGVRMGNELRFGTRGEAEFYQTHHVTNKEDPASSEVIACKDEKANVSVDGDKVTFRHGIAYCLIGDHWRMRNERRPSSTGHPGEEQMTKTRLIIKRDLKAEADFDAFDEQVEKIMKPFGAMWLGCGTLIPTGTRDWQYEVDISSAHVVAEKLRDASYSVEIRNPALATETCHEQ
jgi:hypothetical protein